MRFALLFLLLLAGPVRAAPADEIEGLLRYVRTLDGAAFLRNGATHTPAEAEAHLRLKWSRQQEAVVTAEDFIRLCATKSTLSGEPYRIRFRDGHEEPCADVLHRELARLRHPPPRDTPAAPAH